MRGLKNFIKTYSSLTDIKAEECVANEITKIKKVFITKKPKNYDKRKSVAKLCFINLIGHEILFGFQQIMELISSPLASDKVIGYMAAVIVCNSHQEYATELIPELKKIISDPKQEYFVNLGLTVIASLAGSKFADQLGPTVADIAISNALSDQMRKKALFALSRLYKSSQVLPVVDKVSPRVGQLLRSRNLGVAINCSILALTLVQTQTASIGDIFKVALEILKNLLVHKTCPKEYMRNDIPCPFLCANLFKLLSYKGTWAEDEINELNAIVKVLLDKSDEENKSQKKVPNNSFLFVFSEASLTLTQIPLPEDVFKRYIPLLISYLDKCSFAMEALCNLVQAMPNLNHDLQPAVPLLLKSITQTKPVEDSRALELLYYIASKENRDIIIDTLLPFVKYSPPKLRDDLCTKLAILIQSFAPDSEWKAKKLLELVENGEESGSLIWYHAALSIIQDKENTKEYALKLLSRVEATPRINTAIMKIAAYVIGIECPSTVSHVVEVLENHFLTADSGSQAAIVSCLEKLAMKNPIIKEDVIYFLEESSSSPYFEVAQRSQEARAILQCNFMTPSILTAPSTFVDTTISLGTQKHVAVVDPIQQFLTSSRGVIYTGSDITVSARIGEVNFHQAKTSVTIKIENNSPTEITLTKFSVESSEKLRSKIKDRIEDTLIPPKKDISITVYFVAMDAYSELPMLNMSFSVIDEIATQIPLLPRFFMKSYELTEEVFLQRWEQNSEHEHIGSAQLILPDGDVISEIEKTVLKWMNLKPLKFGIDNNSLYMSGSFATFNGQAGILLRFTYEEEELMLTLDVHSTTKTASSAILKIAKKAFPQCDSTD